MAASLTLQCAFAGAIVLLSVWSVQQLPLAKIPAPPIPIPRMPAVELVPVRNIPTSSGSALHALSAPVPRRVLQVPTSMPAVPKMIVDEGGAVVTTATTGGGSPDGVVGMIRSSDVQAPEPPKPPQVKQHDPEPVRTIQVSRGVQEAKLIRRIVPEYPSLARAARVQGRVQLVAHIGRDGTVRNIQVIGGHPLLVRAAVDAVSKWVYSPTLLNGAAVEVVAPIDVNFTLSAN